MKFLECYGSRGGEGAQVVDQTASELFQFGQPGPFSRAAVPTL